MNNGEFALIKVSDLKIVREELEARLLVFQSAWPDVPEIKDAINRITTLLERLPKP